MFEHIKNTVEHLKAELTYYESKDVEKLQDILKDAIKQVDKIREKKITLPEKLSNDVRARLAEEVYAQMSDLMDEDADYREAIICEGIHVFGLNYISDEALLQEYHNITNYDEEDELYMEARAEIAVHDMLKKDEPNKESRTRGYGAADPFSYE